MDGISIYHARTQNLMALSWFNLDSVVRGDHISKDIWIPVEGEILLCVQETSNRFYPFAVAIKKDK